jgi:hypothetical protein
VHGSGSGKYENNNEQGCETAINDFFKIHVDVLQVLAHSDTDTAGFWPKSKFPMTRKKELIPWGNPTSIAHKSLIKFSLSLSVFHKNRL